jgi:hypothetical protein
MRDINACFCYAQNGIQKRRKNNNKIKFRNMAIIEAVSISLGAMSSFVVSQLLIAGNKVNIC